MDGHGSPPIVVFKSKEFKNKKILFCEKKLNYIKMSEKGIRSKINKKKRGGGRKGIREEGEMNKGRVTKNAGVWCMGIRNNGIGGWRLSGNNEK